MTVTAAISSSTGLGRDLRPGEQWRDYDTWAVLGGIYYDPVPQLTLGLEAEWYTTETELELSLLSTDR